METAWNPEMLAAPFNKMREFLSEHLARTSFYTLGNVAHRVLWMIFIEYVDMIWINGYLDNLNTHFHACLYKINPAAIPAR